MSEEDTKALIIRAIDAIKNQKGRGLSLPAVKWCSKCGAWPVYVYEKLRKDIEEKGGKEPCGCYTFLHPDYGLQTYKIIFLKKLPKWKKKK